MKRKMEKITYTLGGILLSMLLIVGCTGNAIQQITESPPTVVPTGEVKVVTIDSYNWGFNKEAVEINKGDLVRIKLTSSAGSHGIIIPALGVSSNVARPGKEETVEFLAEKSGSFEYFCSFSCGFGHENMKGTITINE